MRDGHCAMYKKRIKKKTKSKEKKMRRRRRDSERGDERGGEREALPFLYDLRRSSGHVTPPTQHTVSSEGVIIFLKLINFKFVHSYNVKHLTCTILCSSGLQNIYTCSIYESLQHLQ